MIYLTTHTYDNMIIDFGFGNEMIFDKVLNRVYRKLNNKFIDEQAFDATQITIQEFEDIIAGFYKLIK